jgi:hypothetical protein
MNITPARASALQPVDPIWRSVRDEAMEAVARDPLLSAFLYSTILNQESLEDAVIHRLAERLSHQDVGADLIRQTFKAMAVDDPDWATTVRVDASAEFLPRQSCALRFVIRGAAVIDGIVKPDCSLDRFRIGERRAIFARQCKQRLDMGDAVIMAPGISVERRKLLFQGVVDQGSVFHCQLNLRQANPFDIELRKIEFTHASI